MLSLLLWYADCVEYLGDAFVCHVGNESFTVVEQFEEAIGSSPGEVLRAVAAKLVWIHPRKVHQGVDGFARDRRPQIEQLSAERRGYHLKGVAQ